MPSFTDLSNPTINTILVKNILKEQLVYYAEKRQMPVESVRTKLCGVLNISKNRLAYWENNTKQPTLLEAIKIASFFEKTVEQIFIKINP